MKKKLILFLLVNLLLSSGFAQQGPNASGGQGVGAGGSVTYTLGQTDYIAVIGSGGSVHQGLQQPYEIQVISGIEETHINLTIAIYPNPATDYLILKVDDQEIEKLTYQLYDTQGKLLINEKLKSNETTINIEQLPLAPYFVKVFKNKNEVKVFKIIKN
ncbi:MAG: T9SS type A sorting domain-containing protein [Bacteroidota bacterium]